jgi:mRNA capping enzyme, beta chain
MPGRKPITYTHLRERDQFFQCPKEYLASLPEAIQTCMRSKPNLRPRVRVTWDQKTNKVLAAIVKIRLADMEVFCPQEAFDIRISTSIELQFPLDQIGNLVEHEERGVTQTRLKDRLSYKHQGMISIDLTQVTSEASGNKVHELELELGHEILLQQGSLMHQGAPNHFEAVVGIFLNYVAVLNRAAKQPPMPGPL